MGKRSKVTVIFVLILVFGIVDVYSDPITHVKPIKIENLETLDDVIFVPGSLLESGKDSFLILINENEIRLYEEGLEKYTAKSFDEKIVSIQLLEKNAPNIFLVATSHKIYFLDESLPKKDPLTFVEEIKKVIAIWNDNKVNYDLLIQYNESINCYSIDGEEEWEEEYLLNEETLLLSTTENGEKIFGNTKNKIFIIDKNGYERTKKEFSEVFSVHPLSDGIVIYCYDKGEYAFKKIEFKEPEKIIPLRSFDHPLNIVAIGRYAPNSDIELIFFQEEDNSFRAITSGGVDYIEESGELIESPVKKIIIEDLDGEIFYYDVSGKKVSHGKNNEFILVTESGILICTVEGKDMKIMEYEIKNLDSFFILGEQNNFSKMTIYNANNEICFGYIFFDYWLFWGTLRDIKRNILDDEDYVEARGHIDNLKEKKDVIEYYEAQDIVQSWESLLNEKIEELRITAENYISQAGKECENGNYMTACDMYYSALIEYRKFESRDEIKKRCEILLSCANELYESDVIENYEIKIKLFSLFFELFSLRGYVGADIIEEIETINSQLKKDFEAFEANHFETFKSALQEIEDGAKNDEENNKLKSATDKYFTLIEPYRELLEDEQKAQELENKVSELDSKIQRQHILYVGISFIVLLGIIYLWRYKKREQLETETKEKEIEEELTEEKIKTKMEGYKKEKKDSKEKLTIFVGLSTAFSIIFGLLFHYLGSIHIFTILFAFSALFSALTTIYYIALLKISDNNYAYLKEELEKQIQKRESNKKNFREFFVDPETGDPDFIVVVGNAFEQYIEPVNEFLRIISEEHFNYTEIIPMYLITEHLGKIKTGEREVTHFVEIDERSLELKDNEIKDVHKIGFNLLLIGFINDNALIKDLIDQGLSKIDWESSNGKFEYISNAFITGRDVIICSGKDIIAISTGLKKLLEKLYEED